MHTVGLVKIKLNAKQQNFEKSQVKVKTVLKSVD